MRYVLVVLCLLFGPVATANAQVSINFGMPSVSIGINVGDYPEMVQVPDYPVYYAPRLGFNFFFYDGLYWAYQRDEWYASSWYNGPWGMVDRYSVPYYILRVPVRYYRDPPQYFRGWSHDAPPRWGQHWGNQWQERRRGWDQWDRKSAPRPAPLPVYQRQYSGDRYPHAEQQHELRNQNYRYQPRETVVRESYKQQAAQRKPETSQRQEKGSSWDKGGGRQEKGASPDKASSWDKGGGKQEKGASPEKGSSWDKGGGKQEKGASPNKGGDRQDSQRSDPTPPRSQPQQGSGQREQQSPKAKQENNPQEKGASQDSKRRQDQDKDKDHEKGDGKGQDRNR